MHLLAACQLRATREIQSQVPASVHSLEDFFTLSHTLPLHDSHINIGFLSAELQENWHGIKSTKWLIKFNLTPSLDAPPEEKQRYDRWRKSNEMAKCYILASISNVLQHQMHDVELVSDIMLSLKEMFGEQGRSAT